MAGRNVLSITILTTWRIISKVVQKQRFLSFFENEIEGRSGIGHAGRFDRARPVRYRRASRRT